MRSITTCGMRARRAQAQAHAHDLGAVLGADHLVRLDAGPLRHRRVDEAGAQRDRAHAVRVELVVERTGESDHRGLRGAVGRQPRCRERAGDRGEVDDPASRLPQERDRGLRDEEEPAQVDGELEIVVLRRQVLDPPADPDPGRVDEHVEAPEPVAVLGDDTRRIPPPRRRRPRSPPLPSSAAAASMRSGRRETSVSSKPSSRSIRAIASPMPDEPPVTSAAPLVEDAAIAPTVNGCGNCEPDEPHRRRRLRGEVLRGSARGAAEGLRPGGGRGPPRRPRPGGRRCRLPPRRRARARLHGRLLPAARRRPGPLRPDRCDERAQRRLRHGRHAAPRALDRGLSRRSSRPSSSARSSREPTSRFARPGRSSPAATRSATPSRSTASRSSAPSIPTASGSRAARGPATPSSSPSRSARGSCSRGRATSPRRRAG